MYSNYCKVTKEATFTLIIHFSSLAHQAKHFVVRSVNCIAMCTVIFWAFSQIVLCVYRLGCSDRLYKERNKFTPQISCTMKLSKICKSF